jgi:hypothetical protein
MGILGILEIHERTKKPSFLCLVLYFELLPKNENQTLEEVG